MKYLKNCLMMLVAVFCLFTVVNAQDKNDNCKQSSVTAIPKIYLEPSQIQILDGTILYEFEGLWNETRALYVDQGGIYVLGESEYGKCRACGRDLNFQGRCKRPGCRLYDKPQ